MRNNRSIAVDNLHRDNSLIRRQQRSVKFRRSVESQR
jgi:hypothetical protein